jgi:hypothetical protein
MDGDIDSLANSLIASSRGEIDQPSAAARCGTALRAAQPGE